MAPAMSTPNRIADERPARSGETFTRFFWWTKGTGAFPFGATATARLGPRALHRHAADGDGRPS